MTDPDFQVGAEVVGYRIIVDDAGVVLLMVKLRGGGLVAWPMSVLMTRDLSADLYEAVDSAIELGGLCPDCGARHDRRERPDADVQLPLDIDAEITRLLEEEESDGER